MCQASCWNRESLDKVLTSDSSRSDLSLNFPDYVQLSCWLIIVCLGDTPLPAHLSGSSCLQCEELHEDRHSVREEDRRQEVSWARSVHLSLSLSLHFLSLSLCLCSSASGVIQELLINNSLITRSKWTIHVQLWMHDSVLMLFMNCHMINWTGQATVIPANAGKSSPSPHKAKVWVATRCNSWVEGRCVWLQPRTSSLLVWTLFSSWICNVGPFSHLVSVNVSWSSQRPVSLCCSINIKHWSKVNF